MQGSIFSTVARSTSCEFLATLYVLITPTFKMSGSNMDLEIKQGGLCWYQVCRSIFDRPKQAGCKVSEADNHNMNSSLLS